MSEYLKISKISKTRFMNSSSAELKVLMKFHLIEVLKSFKCFILAVLEFWNKNQLVKGISTQCLI